MNYLESEISALYASAHELCYLGMDGRRSTVINSPV